MIRKVEKSDEEWRRELTPDQFWVCRLKGTEAPFSGAYINEKSPGIYACAACGQDLFHSAGKYDSGCGWPSFFEPVAPDCIIERHDSSHGMTRTEIVCAACESHLGHVFPDGPVEESGLRYCTNSVALNFKKEDDRA